MVASDLRAADNRGAEKSHQSNEHHDHRYDIPMMLRVVALMRFLSPSGRDMQRGADCSRFATIQSGQTSHPPSIRYRWMKGSVIVPGEG